MDREEAIKNLNEHKAEFTFDFGWNTSVIESLEMAIKALEQEPCGDAISRQAAKANIVFVPIAPLFRDDDVVYRKVIFADVIDALPPVTVQEKTGRWIPVSEKLPEINQRVLVTSYGRVCYAMMTSVDGNSGYPIFRLQDSLNERVICETTVHSEFTTSRIKAWMPLPEPYGGDAENE